MPDTVSPHDGRPADPTHRGGPPSVPSPPGQITSGDLMSQRRSPAVASPASLVGSAPPGVAAAVAAGLRVALADLRTVYTPLTWTLGWLGRIIVQVLFFASIGLLLQSQEAVLYLFVGQAVMACAVEAFLSVASTTWERNTGTLGLLIVAPGPLWPVLVGRSFFWVPSGIATSSVTLFVLGPFLGVEWSPLTAAAAFGCLVLTSVGSYGTALVLGAIVLRGPRWRNVVGNLGHTTMMLLSGVTVPLSFFPGWCQAVGQAFPLTHGLAAIRELAAGGAVDWARVGVGAGLAFVLGAAWLAVAAAMFTRFAATGRRDGSIELDE
ncbi:ABC-2 type transport system permease protein [Actinoalloteichus hoggarensis]|uniref:ABC-2 type transporter n=1 Tax=Actinoalloteichus hoggarensis TaxID=1470176 RepID=A0A221VZ57_9PSEU|nr:ABC transporter permease [Actinoalloteichus hoggarensis]ASO18778.1 ABC-2 type transporter [Actinoalloteichus hoggarensis]MBB5920010.1 ABC-2 type transport system permease protein [Actinoalloteichus hoggarensis]